MENTSAVTTVQAADPNTEQTLSYSISGGADAFRFDINPTSGALSFKTAPDFENPTDAGPNNVYNVTVEASDGNGGTDTQAIAVTVQNAPGLTVNGGNGPDTLAGAGEEDVLRGRNGNDTLRGLAGNDRLEGENGDDSLTGGLGKDLLIGGAGNDRFVFAALADSPPVGFDVIQDFRHGADRIDLAAIDANAAQGGNQAFTFAGQNAAAVANSVTWSQSGGNTFVWVDVDGNTTADLAIQLTGTGLGLTAADFLL
ncbi:Ca2+-binding RTX toxin-like protein [Bradyrhizobium japonicum]